MNKKSKTQQTTTKSKIAILLSVISLVFLLNYSGLIAGTANKPTYAKIPPGSDFLKESTPTSILYSNPNPTTTGADTITKSFTVAGRGACKSSIEGILTSQSGVLSASWDSTAQSITVTFVKHIIKKTQLHRLLAQAGYDNANARAKDAVYSALPAACQYTRLPINVTVTTN